MSGAYDYVFYLDSDAFVSDYGRRLEPILEQYGLLGGDKIMLVASDSQAAAGKARMRCARYRGDATADASPRRPTRACLL